MSDLDADSDLDPGVPVTTLRGHESSTPGRATSDPVSISIPGALYRRLEAVARERERTVVDVLGEAVEIHFGIDTDDAARARIRLIDRLARLEAELGDSKVGRTGGVHELERLAKLESLEEDVRREARHVRRLNPIHFRHRS
jgi:hypothetical protein